VKRPWWSTRPPVFIPLFDFGTPISFFLASSGFRFSFCPSGRSDFNGEFILSMFSIAPVIVPFFFLYSCATIQFFFAESFPAEVKTSPPQSRPCILAHSSNTFATLEILSFTIRFDPDDLLRRGAAWILLFYRSEQHVFLDQPPLEIEKNTPPKGRRDHPHVLLSCPSPTELSQRFCATVVFSRVPCLPRPAARRSCLDPGPFFRTSLVKESLPFRPRPDPFVSVTLPHVPTVRPRTV